LSFSLGSLHCIMILFCICHFNYVYFHSNKFRFWVFLSIRIILSKLCSGLVCTLFFMSLWLWFCFFFFFGYYLFFILSLLCSHYFVFFRLLTQHVLWRWSLNIHVRRKTLSLRAFKFNFMLWKQKLDNYLNVECWNFQVLWFSHQWDDHNIGFLELLEGVKCVVGIDVITW
jgi:hypothetical protein